MPVKAVASGAKSCCLKVIIFCKPASSAAPMFCKAVSSACCAAAKAVGFNKSPNVGSGAGALKAYKLTFFFLENENNFLVI